MSLAKNCRDVHTTMLKQFAPGIMHPQIMNSSDVNHVSIQLGRCYARSETFAGHSYPFTSCVHLAINGQEGPAGWTTLLRMTGMFCGA